MCKIFSSFFFYNNILKIKINYMKIHVKKFIIIFVFFFVNFILIIKIKNYYEYSMKYIKMFRLIHLKNIVYKLLNF